jgi:S1-C subfamily serine protease
MRALKLAGVLVALLGLTAVAIVVAPFVYAQAVVHTREPGLARVQVIGRGVQIGVSIRDVDQADVTREKLPASTGAVVTEVLSDSPAARAGVRAGDVFVEFDGERVRSARQLTRLVEETVEGRTVKAVLMRGGQRIDLELTPEAARPYQLFGGDTSRALERLGRFNLDVPLRRFDFDLDIPEFQFDLRLRAGRLGAGVQQLTPQLAEYFGAKTGVLVTSVTEGSAAAAAGLKAGDVITAVDGTTIDNPSELRRSLQRLEPGAAFSLSILRDRKEMTLKGKLDEPRSSLRRTIKTWL